MRFKLILFSITILALSCSPYPAEVRKALKLAGSNKKELIAVLNYYSENISDSLKLKAAYFLIANLPEQYFQESIALDIYNQEIQGLNKKTVTILMNKWDSIRRIYGDDFKIIKDIDIVDSQFLIENIEMAFQVLDNKWNQSISMEDFFEYILPYKSANEKPQKGWRTMLYNQYKQILDSVGTLISPLDLCILLNKDLKKWFKLSLDYQYPVDIPYSMAKTLESGTCDLGAKTVLYPMRALGLPVAYDFAPFWANRSQRHYWNSLIIDGKHKTFNGGDNDVGSHKVEFIGVGRMKYKPAKILRRTYSVQKNSLPFLTKKGDEIPDIFKNTRLKDVTNQYIPVSDILLTFDEKISSKTRFGYLCTFDNLDWQIYYWGKFERNELIFKDMGRDVAYLPVLYVDKSIIPIGDPFILTIDGEIKICKASTDKKQSIRIISKYPEDESNNIFPGQNYELLYWREGWISLGTQIAKSNYLIFDNTPVNALFWIRNHTEGKQERIFTYEKGKQIWW